MSRDEIESGKRWLVSNLEAMARDMDAHLADVHWLETASGFDADYLTLAATVRGEVKLTRVPERDLEDVVTTPETQVKLHMALRQFLYQRP